MKLEITQSYKEQINKLENETGSIEDAIPVSEYISYRTLSDEPEKYKSDIYMSTKIVITITMYNEDEELFLATLNSLIESITYICQRTKYINWNNIVICIIADGREKINQKVLDVLYLIGVYQDRKECDTGGYVYEYTTQLMLSKFKKFYRTKVPIQILFFLKEQNKKKINSHRWLFKAFCRELEPESVIMIDVGTILNKTAVFDMWYEFYKNKNVAGVCGEMYVDTGEYNKNLLNPLVATQNFEYKMSNILDKPFEDMMGYITVLPGAFSAYRYSAVIQVVDKYLEGENIDHKKITAFTANMFLAEDRILCFNLLTLKNESYTLKYIKSAKAKTDVPSNISELTLQRRRWLNGTFFATLYSILFFYKIFQTNHSYFRKFLFLLQTLYNFVTTVVSYFQISLFYLTFYFLIKSFTNNYEGETLFQVLNVVYITVIFLQFIISLGNKPQAIKYLFRFNVIVFSLFMMFVIYIVIDIIIKTTEGVKDFREIILNDYFRNITISLLSIYGLYILLGILYLDLITILSCFLQYYVLVPLYINIFSIYSVCNIHDISWGTKGSHSLTKKADSKEQQLIRSNYNEIHNNVLIKSKDIKVGKQEDDYFRFYRTNFLIVYMILNIGIVAVISNDFIRDKMKFDEDTKINPYLVYILYYVAGVHLIKGLGSIIYIFKWYITEIIKKSAKL